MQQQLTILFADIANSTWLYQHKGDVVAHKLVSECLELLTDLIEANHGELLRTVGDSVLASFPQPDDAMSAAVAMQLRHKDNPLSLRVGFHTGKVIPDRGDIYGNAVNIAARIASFAKPTEIFTSESTAQSLSTANQAQTSYLDKIDFKGVSTPLAVHRVAWRPMGARRSASEDSSDTKIIVAKEDTSRYRTHQMLELRVAARTYRVHPDHHSLSVGRALDNDIVIDHESTSRNHAVIELFHGKYYFRDTSTNGSYIVSSGGSTHFLRREQAVVEHFGIIGAGWKPEQGDTNGIQFRTLSLTDHHSTA